jgi:hypothetical protein
VRFTPADGEQARWRRADQFIDSCKAPGDLITFKEIQDLLDIDRTAALSVMQQVRTQREKAGKRTLVSMRGAGWLLARPDQELQEDTRRHEHILNSAESRVRLLGAIQARRDELTEDERRTLDFKLSQSAAHAMILGSRKLPAADILNTGSAGQPALPITAGKHPKETRNQPATDRQPPAG